MAITICFTVWRNSPLFRLCSDSSILIVYFELKKLQFALPFIIAWLLFSRISNRAVWTILDVGITHSLFSIVYSFNDAPISDFEFVFLSLSPPTCSDVLEGLIYLDKNKGCGPDKISPCFSLPNQHIPLNAVYMFV